MKPASHAVAHAEGRPCPCKPVKFTRQAERESAMQKLVYVQVHNIKVAFLYGLATGCFLSIVIFTLVMSL